MPASKAPDVRERRNKTSTKATLSLVVDHKVPAMPEAKDWLRRPAIGGEEVGPEVAEGPVAWSPVVVQWWETIWSSPMSNEFHSSDTAQLHLACFYLQQTVNPYLKMSERLAASKAHEACVKNFGLSPMSRRTLQWEIERVSAAQQENAKKARSNAPDKTQAPSQPAVDPRALSDEDEDNPFSDNPVTPSRDITGVKAPSKPTAARRRAARKLA